MIKVTALYGSPKSTDEFKQYYENTHLPLASNRKGVDRLELTNFVPGQDGVNPAFYRMTDLYFSDNDQLEKSLASAEGQATVTDLHNFATGRVAVFIKSVKS